MGNIHASSQGITSSLPPSPVSQSYSNASDDGNQSGSPPPPPKDPLPNNPGTMEDIHKKCKGN